MTRKNLPVIPKYLARIDQKLLKSMPIPLTPTASELLYSRAFAKKRVSDLSEHESVLFWDWESGRLTKERYFELYDSTHGLRLWWEERLKHLNKLTYARKPGSKV